MSTFFKLKDAEEVAGMEEGLGVDMVVGYTAAVATEGAAMEAAATVSKTILNQDLWTIFGTSGLEQASKWLEFLPNLCTIICWLGGKKGHKKGGGGYGGGGYERGLAQDDYVIDRAFLQDDDVFDDGPVGGFHDEPVGPFHYEPNFLAHHYDY